MKNNKETIKKAMELYLVTDRRWLKDHTLANDVEEAIEGGVTCVQIREKNINQDEFINEALLLKDVCQKHQIPLIVNDNIEVMLAIDADGIHVGQGDMDAKLVRTKIGNNKILGVSAQTVEQALIAQEAGADYLGVGAVFNTGTKSDAVEVDFQTLVDICKSVDIPIVAIGGINCENLLKLKGSGIDGVAVVSAIMAQDNIKKASCLLKEKCGELLK